MWLRLWLRLPLLLPLLLLLQFAITGGLCVTPLCG
jgi:hypothetical protein